MTVRLRIEPDGRPAGRSSPQPVRKHALRAEGESPESHPCCRAWVAEQAHGRGWRSAGVGDKRQPRETPES